MNNTKTWYVYVYAYPDGQVFYIGKGTKARMFSHENEARTNCACEKCNTIRSIWVRGVPVQKKIVFESFLEAEVAAYEVALIRSNANEQLMNIQDNVHVNPIVSQSAKLRYQINLTDKKEITQHGHTYVSIPLALSLIGCNYRTLNAILNLLEVKRFKFSFDRRSYILKSDVERLERFKEEKR